MATSRIDLVVGLDPSVIEGFQRVAERLAEVNEAFAKLAETIGELGPGPGIHPEDDLLD